MYHCVLFLEEGRVSATVSGRDLDHNQHDQAAHDRARSIANSPYNDGIDGMEMVVSGPSDSWGIGIDAHRYVITRDSGGNFDCERIPEPDEA